MTIKNMPTETSHLKTKDFLSYMRFENVPSFLEPSGDYVIVTWMYDEKGNRVTDMKEATFGTQRWYHWDGTLIRECDMFLQFGPRNS